MNYVYYIGTSIACLGGLYYFRHTIIDNILLYKATRPKKKTNRTIKLYGPTNNYITSTKLLKTFAEYKKRTPNLTYIEIDYTHNTKNYSIIFDKDFQFPLEFDNQLKGYKREFLSCITNNVDITERINKLLGPNRDFYKSFNIEIPVKYITDKEIKVIDNEINEYTLTINECLK